MPEGQCQKSSVCGGAAAMIPLRLTVRNFLCYGDGVPPLDLENIHVACLCGQNGHGKSALLDAITWALWGKARAKNQDELIHYGQDEMMVDLEFRLRDTRYRVVRRHASGLGRRRSSATDLQLQISGEDGFVPITAASMRETQAGIDRIIGMDYDTFINSAFLLQGRADEFTNKSPGERKEVLARILSLDVYDDLQERAKERADRKRDAASRVEGDLEGMRRDVARSDGIRTELDQVNRELAELTRRVDASKETAIILKTRVDHLRAIRDELQELAGRIPVFEADISNLQDEADSREARITAYEALIGEKDTIECGLARFREASHRYQEMNASRDRFDELAKTRSELEGAVGQARATLEERLRQLERRIEGELRPKVEAAPTLALQLDEARVTAEGLAGEDRDLAERRQFLQELATRIGQHEGDDARLKSEGQDIRAKLNLVQSPDGASCPLCGTELGPEGCRHLADSYKSQIEEKLRLYRSNEEGLKGAQEERVGLEAEISKREGALRQGQQQAQSAIALLERQIAESREVAEEEERLSLKLLGGRKSLELRLYATEDQDELRQVESQILALDYDPATHRHLYDEMMQLQSFDESHGRLQDAVVGLPGERESLSRARDMLHRRREELDVVKQKQRAGQEDVLELPQWEEKLKVAQAEYGELELQQRGLYRRQVELEGDLRRVEALEGQMEGKEAEARALREEQGVYQELVEAFGKRGVQALLIETVLPRIEEEANVLLGRVTDDRMHLKLETQRERRGRRGEPIETLEINVSDEMGPRSYELFSGGEAFRINLFPSGFALSQGSPGPIAGGLPCPPCSSTRVSGPRDAAGRERILDVISAIQNDFEKIIVITHLEELKEAFPVRIEVQKDGDGSSFWMT